VDEPESEGTGRALKLMNQVSTKKREKEFNEKVDDVVVD
jgi:hypothetical protein